MENIIPFGEVLEAADKLSLGEQETLMEILHRRMVERRRAELVKEVRSAHQEFREGSCKPATPSELMQEI